MIPSGERNQIIAIARKERPMSVDTSMPGVKSWASVLDSKTAEQAMMLARSPVTFQHVALMPDAHLGMGATVGSVIATKDAIIPAAIGVDIGCGVIASQTNLFRSDLPRPMFPLHRGIANAVPAGVGKDQGKKTARADNWLEENPIPIQFDDAKTLNAMNVRAIRQLGSLGSGNHFLEVCLDATDGVWMVIHSGSRGTGNILAKHFIEIARDEIKDKGETLEDRDLAYLIEGSESFESYIANMLWAQDYARENREVMMDNGLKVLFDLVGHGEVVDRINCYHNFTQREDHFGSQVWLTRKGAISARPGEFGLVPGSMATATYVVEGMGNPDSYCSSAHGAGRMMSRTKARQTFTTDSLAQLMKGKEWNDRASKQLLDEHPEAYKDIEQVMADMADLVTPKAKLTQVLNYKGA